MAEIKSRSTLERWLHEKPAEWGASVAARSALRSIPALNGYFLRDKIPSQRLLLSVLRSAAVPWYTMAIGPIENAKVLASEVAEDAATADFSALSAASAALVVSSRSKKYSVEHSLATAEHVVDALADVMFSIDTSFGKTKFGHIASVRDMNYRLLTHDCSVIERSGNDKKALRSLPLFFAREDKFSLYSNLVISVWVSLKVRLLDLDEDWDVWTDWYDRILTGKRPLSKEIELYRVTLDSEDDWKTLSPKEINAKIKAKIEALKRKRESKEAIKVATSPMPLASKIDIPPKRPSAIRVALEEDRLVLTKEPATADLSEARLHAALRALKSEIEELISSISSNPQIDQRPIERLKSLANLIGEAPPEDLTVFLLGHGLDKLRAFSKTVDTEWPDLLASDYRGLLTNYERTIRQFPAWRQFLLNDAKNRLSEEQIEQAIEIGSKFADAMQTPEIASHIDPEVPAAIEALISQRAGSDQAGNGSAQDGVPLSDDELLAQDILWGVDDILKTLADFAQRSGAKVNPFANELLENFKSGAGPSLKQQAKKTGKALGPWVGAAFFGLVAAAGGAELLSTFLPDHFGWLGAYKLCMAVELGGVAPALAVVKAIKGLNAEKTPDGT